MRFIELPDIFLRSDVQFAVFDADSAHFFIRNARAVISLPSQMTVYSTGFLPDDRISDLIKWARFIWSPDASIDVHKQWVKALPEEPTEEPTGPMGGNKQKGRK